ncbi:MAG: autotransporter domain-containing protein [Pseudomonadota bacterium]
MERLGQWLRSFRQHRGRHRGAHDELFGRRRAGRRRLPAAAQPADRRLCRLCGCRHQPVGDCRATARSTTALAGVYGSWTGGGSYLDGMLGYGNNSEQLRRTVSFPGLLDWCRRQHQRRSVPVLCRDRSCVRGAAGIQHRAVRRPVHHQHRPGGVQREQRGRAACPGPHDDDGRAGPRQPLREGDRARRRPPAHAQQ